MVRRTIQSLIINLDRVSNRLEDYPCICPTIKCYMFSEKKKQIFKKIITLEFFFVEIQLIMNFWARLSTSCCTPFQRSLFCMWISTKSFIGLELRPSTIACKRKLLLVKHFHIIQQLKNYLRKQNLTVCFTCETNRMDTSISVIMEPWISLF